MACVSTDSQVFRPTSAQSNGSTSSRHSLPRCASLPGRSRPKSANGNLLRRQRFEDMQDSVHSREMQALEQNFSVMDAIVKLDFDAQRFRQGKTVDVLSRKTSTPNLQKPQKSTAGRVRRSTSCAVLGGENSNATRPSLPKLLKVSTSSNLCVPGKPQKRASVANVAAGSARGSKDYEAAQLEALDALVLSLDANKTLLDLSRCVCRHVLTHLGVPAFTVEKCKLALAAALQENGLEQEPAKEEAAQLRVELIVQALRSMSGGSSMVFVDVVGQVLWRQRKTDVLQKKKRREVTDDLSWVMPGGIDDNGKQAGQLQVVDEVFDMFCTESGRMNNQGWRQIVQLVANSPCLADRLNLSDVDRLWYAQTRGASKEILRDISLSHFKALLLALGEAMRVHPWMVFLAVGSYSGRPSPSPSCASTTMSRLSSPMSSTFPSPQSSSRGPRASSLTSPQSSRPSTPSRVTSPHSEGCSELPTLNLKITSA